MANKFKSPEGIVRDIKHGNSFFDERQFADFLTGADKSGETPDHFITNTASVKVPQGDNELSELSASKGPKSQVTQISAQLIAQELDKTTAKTQAADKAMNEIAGGVNLAAIERTINKNGEQKVEVPLLHVDAVAEVEKSPDGAFAKPSNANRDKDKTLEKFLAAAEDPELTA